MSRRRRSDDSGHRYRDGAKRLCRDQKHLYVVLDDWEKGYSIHKIDDRAFEDSRSDHGDDELELADPPVLRLEESNRGVLIGAVGSKIVALWQPTATNRAVAYDTKTAALAVSPPHPDALQTIRFVVAVGKKLYAMHEGGMHCLDMEAGEHQWAWTLVSSSTLRLPGCEDDPDVPIEITAYAVHPDERTIFVSAHAKGRIPRSAYAGTFSLDTGGDGDAAEWKLRGEWLLPFQGQGHYDADLDAWVGLHSPRHVCVCDVPPPLEKDDTPAPEKPSSKLVRAAFSADPDPRRGDSAASLVCLGHGEFCVVESLLAKDEYVQLRLTKFRFGRDRHGPLRASSRQCGALSCQVRKFDSLFSPRAFCI